MSKSSNPVRERITGVPDPATDTSDKTVGGSPELRNMVSENYKDAVAAMRNFSLDFDEYEDMLLLYSRTPDQLQRRVSEGSISSIVVERATRVVSQVPTGAINALSLKGAGMSLLMNIIMQKHIIPGATEQYPHKTKLWLWDLLSNVYGTMYACYDWVARKDFDGYVGPDWWLATPRNVFPQQGRVSITNCDFADVSTFIPVTALEALVNDKVKGYDLEAIEQILERLKGKAAMPAARRDYYRNNPTFEMRRRAPLTNTGEVEIITEYQRGKKGRWISFAPDFDNIIIRNIENPHESGRIPVVPKYGLPLLDSIVGLGDMEKGRYMQYAIDTTLNLQLDGQKLRTYPPLKIVKGNVVTPSIRYMPGAKWLMDNANDVTEHKLTAPDQTLNSSFQLLKAALYNVSGSSTTQVSSTSSSSMQGKTPEAIKDQNDSENTRDVLDTDLFETAYQELMEGMINLVNQRQDDPIELYLFNEEIQQIIGQGYDDVKDLIRYEGKKGGKELKDAKSVFIKIDPTHVKNTKGYQFQVDPGSSQSEDQEAQNELISATVDEYVENAQAIESLLNAGGMTFDFAAAYKKKLTTGGIKDWQDILKPLATASPAGQVGATDPSAAAAVGGMAAPGMPGAPVMAAPQATQVAPATATPQVDPNSPMAATISAMPGNQPTVPAADPNQPQTATAPNGQIHESADLIKFYLASSNDPALQAQIVESLGYTPTPSGQLAEAEPDADDAGASTVPAVPAGHPGTAVAAGIEDPAIAKAHETLFGHKPTGVQL